MHAHKNVCTPQLWLMQLIINKWNEQNLLRILTLREFYNYKLLQYLIINVLQLANAYLLRVKECGICVCVCKTVYSLWSWWLLPLPPLLSAFGTSNCMLALCVRLPLPISIHWSTSQNLLYSASALTHYSHYLQFWSIALILVFPAFNMLPAKQYIICTENVETVSMFSFLFSFYFY